MRLERFPADDGEEIRVQVDGHGPAIVLLHEWASNHRVWAPIAHRLSHRFTVNRWDARGHHGGHGEMPQPASGRPVTIERMADDLRNLLDHFRLERPIVVGHSMGALTLWAYIARYGCSGLGRIGVIDQSPRLITDAEWRLGIRGDWSEARDQAFVAAMRADFVTAVIELVSFGLNQRARQRYQRPPQHRAGAHLPRHARSGAVDRGVDDLLPRRLPDGAAGDHRAGPARLRQREQLLSAAYRHLRA